MKKRFVLNSYLCFTLLLLLSIFFFHSPLVYFLLFYFIGAFEKNAERNGRRYAENRQTRRC